MSFTDGRISPMRRSVSGKTVFTLADVRQVSGRSIEQSPERKTGRSWPDTLSPRREDGDSLERIPCYTGADPWLDLSQLGIESYSQIVADDYCQLTGYDYCQLVAYAEDQRLYFFDDDDTSWFWSDDIFFDDEPVEWLPMTKEIRRQRSTMKRSSSSRRARPERRTQRGRSLCWFDPVEA